MRVALHFPDGSVAAFRQGRILDATDPVTGEVTQTAEEIADRLLALAEDEHPDADARVERFVFEEPPDDGVTTGRWEPVK